ncbi:hypothetical protein EON64_14910 [archaeon]|nr:MAG: hypothetical protein EON64_14910 [archaeon]
MKMRTFWGMLMLFLLVIGLEMVNAAKDSKKSSGSTRKQKDAVQLISEKLSTGSLIALTDSTFNMLVMDRPRDYHAVVMLTATDPKYSCSICQKGRALLEEAAKAYNSQYAFNTSMPAQRVAFFVAEVDRYITHTVHIQYHSMPYTYVALTNPLM